LRFDLWRILAILWSCDQNRVSCVPGGDACNRTSLAVHNDDWIMGKGV
jgi:hypothetical protein